MDAERTLLDLMNVALKAADPYRRTFESLPERPEGQLFILAVGKAASRMSEAAADFYGEGYEGILFTQKNYGKTVKGFRTYEGDHPLPSPGNVQVTRRIIEKIEALGKNDMLLALISGGTSALLCAPLGVTLEEKIRITQELLKSGADIGEINKTRKEISAVKGGKLAELARPAEVVTLLVSDVTGDDPLVIGSAPTGGGEIVLKSDDMLGQVRREALHNGISVSNLGQVEGEASDVARDHADIALGYYGSRPHLIVSGGETSVTVSGGGQGGRNSEYALALAIALGKAEGVYGLAIDTDGIDGANPFAGALVKPDTLRRAEENDFDPKKTLKNNNSGKFFEVIDDAINTGPTFTNLNDLRMTLLV